MTTLDLTPGTLNVTLVQGDDLGEDVITFTFTDDNGDPIDLTGLTIEGPIQRSYTGNNSTVVTDWNFTVLDAANGIVTPTVDTSDLDGLYVHSVCLSGTSFPKKTYLDGTLKVIARGC